MPNGFIPKGQFEQFVYDELKHQTQRLDGMPCDDHAEDIKKNNEFRNKALGAYIVIGVLIGGGVIGLVWAIIKGVTG